jgi:predicted dehydrogenase
MGDTVRVGVIGAGVIGQEHMQLIADLDSLHLSGVMDVNAGLAQESADRHGVPSYKTLADLLENSAIQAVHVCTPHTQHLGPVLAAAGAGKHVLLEKPMALTLDECDRMIAACEDAGVVFMIGQSLRYDQAHVHVRDLIARDTVGSVGHIMLRWYDYFDPTRQGNPYGTWYIDRDLGGICLLHTFGPHVFDIMPWFVSSPVIQVYAQGSENTPLYEGQSDSLSATLTHESGTVSTLSLAIATHSDAYDINFVGSAGSIELVGRTVTVNGEAPGADFPVGLSMRSELEHFAVTCLEHGTPDSNGQSVRETMAVIEAARLSAERGAVVDLAELK